MLETTLEPSISISTEPSSTETPSSVNEAQSITQAIKEACAELARVKAAMSELKDREVTAKTTIEKALRLSGKTVLSLPNGKYAYFTESATKLRPAVALHNLPRHLVEVKINRAEVMKVIKAGKGNELSDLVTWKSSQNLSITKKRPAKAFSDSPT